MLFFKKKDVLKFTPFSFWNTAMFARFMPRDAKYFELFNNHADLIAKGGVALFDLTEALVEKNNERATEIADLIDKIERQADDITHEVLSKLHTSFITPFDRDEIHSLISHLDDVLDIIQDVAEVVFLYDVKCVPEEVKNMGEITMHCCERIQAVVKLLHSMDNSPAILRICHEIAELETATDRQYREAMSRLFREEPDVRELIKIKQIYEVLESVTDHCKDVATTIESIVLENS